MKKFFCAALAVLGILIPAAALFAWTADGVIPGTEIAYSGLDVSKNGVAVRLDNTSANDVKVSLKLVFFDMDGNQAGYSVFGLRTIAAGEAVELSGNHLSGKWKACRDSARINFSKMTYEPIY